MNRLATSLLLPCLFTSLTLCGPATSAAQTAPLEPQPLAGGAVEWHSQAQHLSGLQGVKPQDKGSLTVTPAELRFRGKSGSAVIPVTAIAAVSVGNQRVELWGMKGRILRMAIPDGGGLAAAAVMHHRVDMLTVEYDDRAGGYHAAAFVLSASDAQRAMQKLAAASPAHHEPTHGEPGRNRCDGRRVRTHTVRVLMPEWSDVEVPAAYRALLYENVVERMSAMKGIDYVYRDGEADGEGRCAEYTVQLTTTGFKPGSQVRRAAMGPVGMFAGTTQLVFDVHITNTTGTMNYRDETKATVRGETESIKVTDAAAKKLVKQFAKAQKQTASAQYGGSGLR